jgi:hypothetical protein
MGKVLDWILNGGFVNICDLMESKNTSHFLVTEDS